MSKRQTFGNLAIFLDESGASGNNFLAPPPYYIQGGVIVEESKIDKLRATYLTWENKHKQPNQTEIKSSIFSNPNGFSKFSELFEEVRTIMLSPAFAVLDKRYAISFSCIEAFLDSFYNTSHSNKDFFLGGRRGWANQLLRSMTPETLHHANEVLRNRSYESFVKAHEGIVADLRKNNENELAKKIDACPREEAFRFLAQNKEVSMAINAIAFRSHMFSIKEEFIKHPPVKIRFVHDEQLHYQDIFKDFMEITNKGEPRVTPISEDKNVIWGEVGDWTLEFVKSENEPIVRLSDLVCGFLRSTLRFIDEAKPLPAAAEPICRLWWTPMIRHIYPGKFEDLPKWNFEGIPETTQERLAAMLFRK